MEGEDRGGASGLDTERVPEQLGGRRGSGLPSAHKQQTCECILAQGLRQKQRGHSARRADVLLTQRFVYVGKSHFHAIAGKMKSGTVWSGEEQLARNFRRRIFQRGRVKKN